MNIIAYHSVEMKSKIDNLSLIEKINYHAQN